ncbi:MAG: hypothetical protein BroJett040_09190 [Oligoflexia bacterium]|nr:MAG: hypothetical protein BroJett040_09190 [Oligoflexia bacterium]
MSLENRIGQLFMLGIPDDGESLSDYTKTLITKVRPGGIILFKRNIKSLRQVSLLNESLQKYSVAHNGTPLLIALDQEGGRVVRIKTTPALPSPLAVGNTRDPQIAFQLALASGKILRGLGFNMNLAPVLDTIPDDGQSFIGERSFGSDPALVSRMGLASAQGMLTARVLPTAKHFPGSGQFAGDPHQKRVVSNVENKSLLHVGVQPFQEFGSLFPSALMLSHVAYPQIDSSSLPATFSQNIIEGLLRKNLDYQGLVLTDDLQMGGAKIFSGIDSAATASLSAGADMLMITWSANKQSSAYQSVLKAATSKIITQSSINNKVDRILKIKGILQPSLHRRHPSWAEDSVEDLELQKLDEKILDINLSREIKKIPELRENDALVLISSNAHFRWQFERSLNRPIQQIEISRKNSRSFLNGLRSIISKNNSTTFLLPIFSVGYARWAESLPDDIRSKVIVVNAGPPGLFKRPAFKTVLEINHPHQNLGRRLGELLSQRNSRLAKF